MNIEEIMKPYFDKKEEITRRPQEFQNSQNEIINRYEEENKKYREENQRYESELTAINVRLNNLRNNKDKEIEEFVQNAVSDRPDFYVGYGAMIRKDLEQEYLKREKELQNELEMKSRQLSQKISDNYLQISVNNKLIGEQQNYKFYNVDVRELVDVKHDLRKSLISAKKELETKLQEIELRFDAVMYKLSTFKYEYDENHNVLNGKEYRELFELSNSLIEVKYNLQRDLKQVAEYLNLTELTEEEVKTVMMSMSELEKEEYNKRKNLVQKNEEVVSTIKIEDSNEIEEQTPITELTEEIEPVTKKNILEEPIVETIEEVRGEPTIVEDQNIIYEQANAAIESKIVSEENYSKFIDEIATDVLKCVKRLRTVKIKDGKLTKITPGEENKEYEISGSSPRRIELVNGLYLNRHDVENATRNYKRQNKGRTFTVKGTDKALSVTSESVNKVKEILRKFSLQDLLIEKKISVFDVKRVYGKEKTEEYINDEYSVEFRTEDYVRVKDVYQAFKELFTEKTPTWLEKLTSKFRKNEVEETEEVQDAEYEQVEDKMTWNAEEPEYEIVRAKTK